MEENETVYRCMFNLLSTGNIAVRNGRGHLIQMGVVTLLLLLDHE